MHNTKYVKLTEAERALFDAVEEVDELADRYACRFPAEPRSVEKLIQLTVFELLLVPIPDRPGCG